jgi:putative transcriptional regulator
MYRGDKVRTYLIAARKGKNLTHETIADKVGITRQYYGMIENDERTPSVPIAKEIGKILEIEWTLFFEQQCNLGLQNGVDSSSS